jgi:hypothetical protein
MPRLAAPVGVIVAGASILTFALTADVWQQAEPLQIGELRSEQALAPPESQAESQVRSRPAAKQRPTSATERWRHGPGRRSGKRSSSP